MRKLMCLILVISGVSMGCGDSDSDTVTSGDPASVGDAGDGSNGGDNIGSDDTNGGGNTGGIALPDAGSAGGEVPDPYPTCDRAMAVGALGAAGTKWTGAAPWTMTDFSECMKLCPSGQLQCFQDMCNKGMDFVDCYAGEIGFCAASGDSAPCKTQWENLGCCASANPSCTTDQNAFNACTSAGGTCANDTSAFSMCAQTNCQNASAQTCISADAGGGGDATTGAGDQGANAGGMSGLSQAAFQRMVQLLH